MVSALTERQVGAAPGRASSGRSRARMEGVTKRFGSFLANHDVTIDIPAGAVVGLVGENGAGKTTAMNILAGLYLPDRGRIVVDGRLLRPGSPRDSVAGGIGMVHQQFKLVETLSGFENISLAVDGGRFLQPASPGVALRSLMAEVGFDLDLSARVWQMTLSARQQLEILRTLAIGANIVVLDEPTSVLSPLETVRLFEAVRAIAASGRSVVFISHKLLEVLDIADQLVVMRGGRVVHAGPARDIGLSQLARLVVGERMLRSGVRPPGPYGESVLQVEDLQVSSDLGLPAVRNVSFEVRAGELVAVVGVTGNGQSELLDAIGGLRRPTHGRVRAPRHGGRRGFAYIPAQHLGVGLAPHLSVQENAILGQHGRPPFGWWLGRRHVRERAQRVVDSLGVRADVTAPVARLSGGNLQRIVLGRELHGNPRLIVASYPTRGLDVASASQMRRILVERARAGAGVLVSSEELDESLEIASRVLVMHRGRIVAERDPRDVDLDELGRLMTTGEA